MSVEVRLVMEVGLKTSLMTEAAAYGGADVTLSSTLWVSECF